MTTPIETHIEKLRSLLTDSNAGGNDLTKRNIAIDMLVGPKMFDHEISGNQTERLIRFTITMIEQGKAFVSVVPTKVDSSR